jgi:predicted GIY-YIG superfamily endonuclease
MSWNCYFLRTCDGGSERTYIGATPDIDRRLKQHNRLLTGGAAATQGRRWERVCHVAGFPDQRAALQFEWRWKRLSQKVAGTPSNRRLRGLELLLALDRPTTAAVPYETYEAGGPTVIMELI